jgi:hypothetical protein
MNDELEDPAQPVSTFVDSQRLGENVIAATNICTAE